MTSDTVLRAKLYEDIADDFEQQAANLLRQANKLRALAAGRTDWPSDDEDDELQRRET